jgi:ribosomal-protein-alanine N-acetyltransferase
MTLPLQTERLVVRELTTADLDDLVAIFSDPQVLLWEPAFTREQLRELIEESLSQYRADGVAEYAVVLRASDALIGVCGPVYRDIAGERLPELGWDLRSDRWGHGYATEAARGVVAHARDLGLPRLYSLVAPGNVRSQGVARRLGMTVERRVVWRERDHDLWALDVR